MVIFLLIVRNRFLFCSLIDLCLSAHSLGSIWQLLCDSQNGDAPNKATHGKSFICSLLVSSPCSPWWLQWLQLSIHDTILVTALVLAQQGNPELSWFRAVCTSLSCHLTDHVRRISDCEPHRPRGRKSMGRKFWCSLISLLILCHSVKHSSTYKWNSNADPCPAPTLSLLPLSHVPVCQGSPACLPPPETPSVHFWMNEPLSGLGLLML